MENIDGDSGAEGYLYEPERADFPNIKNDLTYDDSSSDNEGKWKNQNGAEHVVQMWPLFTIENQQ